MKEKVNVFWFRRDLRLHDNHGLFQALKSGLPVLPVFVFDTEILGKLDNREDARVFFIYREIQKLKAKIEKAGSSLMTFHGRPLDAFKAILNKYDVRVVFANEDYEPYSRDRDKETGEFIRGQGAGLELYKDHVIFAKNEVVKDDGFCYAVFTPYSRKWKSVFNQMELPVFPSENFTDIFLKTKPFLIVSLDELGFRECHLPIPEVVFDEGLVRNYEKTRDLPFLRGTSRLGVHLRFGTISIREITRKAAEWSPVFLDELIWRNFFSTILWHFPDLMTKSFKPQYDFIQWRNNEQEFKRWCNGQTGYPIVDAGMRELNATGFMHNRVRMITASFLTKHLLVDWRWGEAYFAGKLLDYKLASNNGNWQWAAGTGCDAAPYFRIFNPETQQKKFDPKGEYVLKWVPEAGTIKYPQPMVEHKFARERALEVYRQGLGFVNKF